MHNKKKKGKEKKYPFKKPNNNKADRRQKTAGQNVKTHKRKGIS